MGSIPHRLFFCFAMIKLFTYEGYTVRVEPEALMLAPFKAIWDRDKSKGKYKAMQELAFIYFMGDPRSDYQYLVDPEVRANEIKKGEGLDEDWYPDSLVDRALVFYESFKPASAGPLEDTKYFVDKFRERIREISDNLDGLEVKELKEALAMMKQIPSLSKDLEEAERTLSKDVINEARARGSQTKSLYEDES